MFKKLFWNKTAKKHVYSIEDKEFSDQAEYKKELKKIYPKAYEQWSDEEDELLSRFVKENKSIEEISNTMERQPSAIEARIEKLLD